MSAEARHTEDQENGRGSQTGYTLIEIVGVTALVVLVALMTQGMMTNYKRFGIEETCVQRLQQVARVQETFRHSNDPTVNPEGTYGTFFDLQNAGLIPEIYDESDEKRHTVNAFVPYYRLEFYRAYEEEDLEPDAFNYMVEAIPLYNSMGLKTFYLEEDGEVRWELFDLKWIPR